MNFFLLQSDGARQVNDERDFGKLRGLEPDSGDPDPPTCAADLFRHQKYQNQPNDGQDHQRYRCGFQLAVIDVGKHEHGQQTDSHPHGLPFKIVQGI